MYECCCAVLLPLGTCKVRFEKDCLNKRFFCFYFISFFWGLTLFCLVFVFFFLFVFFLLFSYFSLFLYFCLFCTFFGFVFLASRFDRVFFSSVSHASFNSPPSPGHSRHSPALATLPLSLPVHQDVLQHSEAQRRVRNHSNQLRQHV